MFTGLSDKVELIGFNLERKGSPDNRVPLAELTARSGDGRGEGEDPPDAIPAAEPGGLLHGDRQIQPTRRVPIRPRR
jgi:hypothetical protein